MKRLLLLFSLCIVVLYARPADAQRAYFDGSFKSNSTFCPVTNNLVTVLQTYTGYFTDLNAFPQVGDLSYVHAVGVNVSPCVNDAVGFEFFLPVGASLAISATNPVYCFRGRIDGTFTENVPNSSNSACSQTSSTGLNGGLYFGYSALPPGWFLEVQVPVVFSQQLFGLAGPNSHRLTVASSSAYGTLFPFQPVTVFQAVAQQSLTVLKSGTGTVTSSPGGIDCGATCSASFSSGSSVTLTASPAVGWLFSGWTAGPCAGSNPMCTVAMNSAQSVTATFAIPPAARPDAFSFNAQTSVPLSSLRTSNSVAITGLVASAPISVTNGEYSQGCTATFVSTAGTISPGQSVCVRHTSAATAVTAVTTTLTIGGVAGTFTSTTAGSVPSVPTRLINLSTRGQVQTGDNVMIGGFIIGGASSKTVLIRAVGPNLANFGVPGVLANPTLQLFSGQTVIGSNDNWGSASNAAAIQATGLAPANSLESAILVTLAPGAYTAIVSGGGGGTGVGIIEVFEMDNPTIPLVNISTRGQVQTGDNVMIGGFIIQGSASQTVLIRAVGPNLANFGVPGVLANPTLQLFSGQTVIASNDDWQSASNAAAIQATGLAPANSLESAILITLAPGAYTAIVSGVGGATGVGIVEMFAQ